MSEKVKDKDAEAAKTPETDETLNKGLEDTFPASDPVSPTQPQSKEEGGAKR
jgi:hypothetical protein